MFEHNMWPAPQYQAASLGPAHGFLYLYWANTGHTSPGRNKWHIQCRCSSISLLALLWFAVEGKQLFCMSFNVDLFLASILVIPIYVNYCSDANIKHIFQTSRNTKQLQIQFFWKKINCSLLLSKIRREVLETSQYLKRKHKFVLG